MVQNLDLDRVAIAPLIQRYKKTKLYAYLKDLNIVPIRDGLNSFISPTEAALIDQYHLIKGQGKQAQQAFLERLAIEHGNGSGGGSELVQNVSVERLELVQNVPQTHSPNVQNVQSEVPNLWRLAEAIASFLPAPAVDPLLPQRQLEEIVSKGWVVSSSQLRAILGAEPKKGDRLGFHFVRVGKVGRELAWRVNPVDRPS